MRRREVLRVVVGGGAAGLLASCVAAPAATSGPTVGPTATPSLAPTVEATATLSVAPTVAATATPTLATTAAPTVPPTAEPTVATPPALAAAVDTAMQRAMQHGALPGGVALVRHHGVQIMLSAYGLSRKYESQSTLAPEPLAAAPDTLYDLASITKLLTTTALMRLVEQGRLALDTPVAHWLPEFAAGGKEEVTPRQLLTHTSGLPDLLKLWQLEHTPEARMQLVLAAPLLNPPGTVFRYSDLGPMALGHLLEQVTGSRLSTVVHDLVTGPLGLRHLEYRPATELKSRIAPTEDEQAVGRGMVWGEVHDENSWSLGGVAGHAGLFGTAADLGAFAQVYLDEGVLGSTRLLTAETVREMRRNQIGRLGSRGIGFELNASYYMGRLASATTFGHTGFTGTSLVIDPTRQLIVVLLTNRVHPTRDGPSINATRQAVADAALAAVEAG